MLTERAAALGIVPCIGLVIAACSVASANDGPAGAWMRVARDSNYDIAIDTSRFERRSFREYLVWFRTQHGSVLAYKGKRFNREVVQAIVRCDNLTYKIVSVDMSLNGGRIISRQRADVDDIRAQPWRQVDDGTIEATVAHATCQLVRDRATSGRH